MNQTSQKEIVFNSTDPFLKERHVKNISNDLMVGNAEGHNPMSRHYGAKIMCIKTSYPA